MQHITTAPLLERGVHNSVADAVLSPVPGFSCRFIITRHATEFLLGYPFYSVLSSPYSALMSLGWGVAAFRGDVFSPLAYRGASILPTI